MTKQEQADHYANEIARMVGDEGFRWYNVRDAWIAGMKAGIERAAEILARKAEIYPTDVFPEPRDGGKSPDCYSAGMARHCSRIWADDIRAEMGGAS